MSGMGFEYVSTQRVVVRRTFLEVCDDESEVNSMVSPNSRIRASSAPCVRLSLSDDCDHVLSSDESQSPKTASVATTPSWADSWDEMSYRSDSDDTDMGAWDTKPMPASMAARSSGAEQMAGRKTAAAAARVLDMKMAITSCTSVMFRNLPKKMTQAAFLQTLNAEGFNALYDFAYLPISFQKMETYGYAVVNFISHLVAQHAMERFSAFMSWSVPTRKASITVWNVPTQGLAAHVERYRNSPLMHQDVPQELKPMLFSYGFQMRFPPATKQLKAPPTLPKRKVLKRGVRGPAHGTATM